MSWTPDKGRNGKPVYKQIAAHLESLIGSGAYPPGTALPSERELAKQLGVNRSTVVAAYDELRSYGLVTRVRGSGTIVKHPDDDKNSPSLSWERFIRGGMIAPNDRMYQKILTEARSHPEHINFAMGELHPDLSPIELIEHLTSTLKLGRDLGYEHPLGNQELREALSAHLLKGRGIRSVPSSILVTSGAQQALHLVVQCLLQPGDAVAIEDPSYAYSLPLFHSSGLRTVLLPSGPSGVKPEDIAEAYQQHRVKMVFLNPNFQNPTGSLLDTGKRREILKLAARYGIVLVEDDPYSLIRYDGEPVATLKSMDESGSVLYISSLSKIVASGLRIGWIVGPHSVIGRLADAKQQLDFGQSVFPQWIAARILASGAFAEHLEQLRMALRLRRDLLAAALTKYFPNQAVFRLPEGGIHLWCEFPGMEGGQRLFTESLQRGVMYTPGSLLGTSRRHIRFTFSRPDEERIEEGIRRFREAFQAT